MRPFVDAGGNRLDQFAFADERCRARTQRSQQLSIDRLAARRWRYQNRIRHVVCQMNRSG